MGNFPKQNSTGVHENGHTIFLIFFFKSSRSADKRNDEMRQDFIFPVHENYYKLTAFSKDLHAVLASKLGPFQLSKVQCLCGI